MRVIRSFVFLLPILSLLLGPISTVHAADNVHPPLAPLDQSRPANDPVSLPRSQQYDFRSRLNGRDYRLMISVPARIDGGKKFPVFWVLDGYWYFHAAARTVPALPGDFLEPAIVVGVGYPTDDFSEQVKLRTQDLVPPPVGVENGKGSGAADTFIRILLEEIRPFVAARLPVDPQRQTLFGMSNGGLLALRMLFRHPDAFQTYVAASPAIFQNDRVILKDEPAFSELAKAGRVQARLLITSASDEQYRGSDPQLLAADYRFVDDATEMAARLTGLNPGKFPVTRVIFPDEVHKSVSLASLSRGLRFALRP
jgi:predicted alpha/beta superfamily hydrolase